MHCAPVCWFAADLWFAIMLVEECHSMALLEYARQQENKHGI